MVNDELPQDGAGNEPDPTQPAAPARVTGDVTLILSRIEQGEPQAAEQLLPLVYEELRKLASAKMAQEKPGQTLQATALVHEAYIRLVDVDKAQHWNSRAHFFAAAAQAMQHLLVDRARQKARVKRGGGRMRLDFEKLKLASEMPPDELLALNEAIESLASEDAIAAHLVRSLYFAGFSVEQAASMLDISVATAYRHWAFARAWLHCELGGHDD